jgi:hypothetical protein
MNFLFELSGETGSRLNWPSPVRISASANNGSDSECFRHGTNDTPLAEVRGYGNGNDRPEQTIGEKAPIAPQFFLFPLDSRNLREENPAQ